MIISNLIPEGRFAIAYSGGGDSTALIYALRVYDPLVLIVDHGLRAGSEIEAQKAAAFARGLNLKARVLTWSHEVISSGIQEKAREARYKMLGDACREVGIKYLLTGHTKDDQAETLLMRYDRGTDWRGAAGMSAQIYAPLWPALVDVTLVRPLLNARRSALRAYNRKHGLTWTEDPSNQNPDFERIRARQYLMTRPELRDQLLMTAAEMKEGLQRERHLFKTFCKAHVRVDAWGLLHCDRVPPPALLGWLCQIAGGSGQPVDRQKLSRLARAMVNSDFAGETLTGALVIKSGQHWIIGPDPVVYKGRKNKPPIRQQSVAQHEANIWDGRFHFRSMRPGLRVRALGEDRTILSESQRDVLRKIPPIFRGAMPVIQNIEGTVFTCPGGVSGHPDIDVRCLIPERLNALWDS